MNVTREQFDIMTHTRDRAAGGFYCGGSREMEQLLEAGLMESAGFKGFCPDEFYKLTKAGRDFLNENPSRP